MPHHARKLVRISSIYKRDNLCFSLLAKVPAVYGSMSSYLRSSQPAQSSGTEASTISQQSYGLISFLGLAQRLGITFLSPRWLTGLTILGSRGRGGQATILEGATLAYKRFRRQSYADNNTDFQEPVNELLALTQPAIKDHPHMTQLKGLCWDFSKTGQVYPVLVFDMSKLGDLHHFASSEEFQRMSLHDRVQLCLDVGFAIRDLHASSKASQLSARDLRWTDDDRHCTRRYQASQRDSLRSKAGLCCESQ